MRIDYTALQLTEPTKTLFRYRLERFDTDWIDAGTRRQAYYRNLPPRSYRFVVQARGLFQANQPDVTLMDLRLPGLSGVDAIREIHRLAPARRWSF